MTKHHLILVILLFAANVGAQSDEKSGKQFEVFGGTVPLGQNYYRTSMLGLGVNVPTKNRGWYNTYSASMWCWSGFNPGRAVYTIAAGKTRQYAQSPLFLACGFSGGLVYSTYNRGYLTEHLIGPSVSSRVELGWNREKFVLTSGFFIQFGGGYYWEKDRGNYTNPPANSWFKFSAAGGPYLKVIVK